MQIKKIRSLIVSSVFKRYFANSVWLLSEQVLRMSVALFIGIWVARYLGPEQFGLFSYVIALKVLFSNIVKLGLDDVLVKEMVPVKDEKMILSTSFWMKLIGFVVAFLALYTSLPMVSGDAKFNNYIVIALSGFVFQGFDAIKCYFQSKVLAKYASICMVVQLVISSIIKVYLISIEASLHLFFWVIFFDQLSLSVSYVVAYSVNRKKIPYLRCFDLKLAKQLFKESWPLMFSGFVTLLYMRIDQIMIKSILGLHSIGIYSAAVKLAEMWYFIPVLLSLSLFPAILKIKDNTKKYNNMIQLLYRFMALIAIPLSIVMSMYSKEIIVLLYGEAYSSAAGVLSISIWSNVFVFISFIFTKHLLASNSTLDVLKRTIAGALLNISLNYYLIPLYGIEGAAIATLFSHIFSNYLFDLVDRKYRLHFIMKTKAIFFLP